MEKTLFKHFLTPLEISLSINHHSTKKLSSNHLSQSSNIQSKKRQSSLIFKNQSRKIRKLNQQNQSYKQSCSSQQDFYNHEFQLYKKISLYSVNDQPNSLEKSKSQLILMANKTAHLFEIQTPVTQLNKQQQLDHQNMRQFGQFEFQTYKVEKIENLAFFIQDQGVSQNEKKYKKNYQNLNFQNNSLIESGCFLKQEQNYILQSEYAFLKSKSDKNGKLYDQCCIFELIISKKQERLMHIKDFENDKGIDFKFLASDVRICLQETKIIKIEANKQMNPQDISEVIFEFGNKEQVQQILKFVGLMRLN